MPARRDPGKLLDNVVVPRRCRGPLPRPCRLALLRPGRQPGRRTWRP